MTDPDRLTRRSVLKATAAAASGGLLASPAAAGHLQRGDCADVTFDTDLWGEACPLGDPKGTVPAGTRGSIHDECIDDDGIEWAYLLTRTDPGNSGWVRESDLEPC